MEAAAPRGQDQNGHERGIVGRGLAMGREGTLEVQGESLPLQMDSIHSGGGNDSRVDGEGEGIPAEVAADIEAEFQAVPASTSLHFFVDTDSSDLVVVEEAAGLDPAVTTP
jgi:hypothetical protein